jgi:hypothetical protein
MLRPGGRRRRGIASLVAGILGAQGCGSDLGFAPKLPPEVLSAVAASSARNVLALLVTVEAGGADSVWVLYAPAGDPRVAATPATRADGGPVLVPVLGLRAETEYELSVVAAGAGGSIHHELPVAVTGSLPVDLPAYVAGGADPSAGYVVFAAGRYGLAIDSDGRVVWYRAFPDGPGLNFQAQSNGRYYARPPPSEPGTPARWVEIDPTGEQTRSFGCARGLQPRFHDIIVESDGGYWIMCDETRTMDLSGYGGVVAAAVTGTVVQHMSAEERLLFEWSPFGQLAVTDLAAPARSGPTVNWTHGNALTRDVDGNLLVSFRSLDEITKIDVVRGSVLWRMGGSRSQFAFEGPSGAGFARQHGVRVTGPGELTLLDNSGDPSASRVERYVYEPATGKARLVASHAPAAAVIAQLGGTTQALPGGRVLVAYGDGARVQEYDASGSVVWEIEGSAGYVFRAERVASLYDPVPLAP